MHVFQLDVELFMQIQEAFQPDFYQALCDADTDSNSSRKRCIKSMDRTLDFLDKIIDKHNEKEVNILISSFWYDWIARVSTGFG